MIFFLFLVATGFSACQLHDFVNSNSSPSIETAAFTRNDDIDDPAFGTAGSLQFKIRLPNFASLNEIRFEHETSYEADGTTPLAVANEIIGFSRKDQTFTTDGCFKGFTSADIPWANVKGFLTLKDSNNEDGAYTQLHYRAEIVVKTTNPYDPAVTQDQGIDALTADDTRERKVTTSFQLYFTLPEFVQAKATIVLANLPVAGIVEKIQMQGVATTLDRGTLLYTTVMGLHSTINWPYILTLTSAAADEASNKVPTVVEIVDKSDTSPGRSSSCTRLGTEDEELDCVQYWDVTVEYATGCGEDVSGEVDLVFTNTNALPKGDGTDGSVPVLNNGVTGYTIAVTSESIQCAVDAGDVDMFATLVATGTDFQIGGVADFTLKISDVQLPGVTVTNLKLNEVGTTQDGQERLVHVFNYAAITGSRTDGVAFNGDGGASAVTLTDDQSVLNSGTTTFQLNLHQTIFNLDAFLDGSSENLLVDATGQIAYDNDGGRRRRRLMNFGPNIRATVGQSTIGVSYHCGLIADKQECKTAKTTDGRCRWNKKTCVPKRKQNVCSKLGPKMCKKTMTCIFKQKTKSCFSATKLKCVDIANTQELCIATNGCLTIMQGSHFKGCRGTVKMG